MDENQRPTTQHNYLSESLYGIPGSLLNLIQRIGDAFERPRSLKVCRSPPAIYGPSPDTLQDAVSLGHEICAWTGSIAYGIVRTPVNDHARARIHKHGITTDSIRDAPYTMKLALTNAVYYATLVYFFRSQYTQHKSHAITTLF